MKGLITYSSMRKRGVYLGTLLETAAARNSTTPITLDHDLDVLPEAGRHMTVTELARHVDDLAGRLAAAGVRPKEHVVIYKTANFDAWLLACAVGRVGAVPVMLSPRLDGPTVGALLERLVRPRLLTDEAKLDVMADVPVADLAEQVIIVAGSRPGAVSLADLAGSPPVEPVPHEPHDAAMITHTSGTTGIPKLIVHTPRTMYVRLRPQWWLLSLMRKRETVAITIPFVHSRMYAAMALVLLKAMPILITRESDPDKIADWFSEHKPGFIEALPNAFMEWERVAEDPRKPFASVKYFSCTFDAIHPRTMSRLLASSERRAPLFYQIYGQSEIGPAVGRPYFRKTAHKANGRCVGFHMPGSARIRVVSRDGKRPSEANPGRIEAKWKGNAKTYFAEEERFNANLDGKWWFTGDVGFRTRLGCIHMLDREVDMIRGVRSSLEIEDLVLSRLPDLSELAVVHGPDSEPIPVICTHEDKPLDRERWREAVADFPELAEPIQVTEDELPRTATLKVRRLELARRLEEQIKNRA